MFFACIYIPDFILQSAMRADPELRLHPAGILDGNPPFVVVIAANKQAKAQGLQPGMTKLQADEFRGVQFRQRALAHEEAAHQALLDLGLSFSPRIEESAIDAVTLDLQGLMQIFGSMENLARGIEEQATKFGLSLNVAVGSNPDAAQLGARGFAGVTLFEPASQSERLGSLPVSALNASAEIQETLDDWGVRSCKALAELPREKLSERLGQEGLLLQEVARGTRHRALIPTTAKLHFEEAIELDTAVRELEPLAFVFSRMVGQLCERLSARGLAPIAIRLRMQLEPGDEEIFEMAPEARKKLLEPRQVNGQQACQQTRQQTQQQTSIYEHTLRLPLPMRDSKALLRLWRLHLEAYPPASPIIKVQMLAEPAPPRVLQAGLFTPLSPDPEKLEITMVRTAHLVEQENVGAAELPDTHRPLAFCMKRFDAMQTEAKVKKSTGSIHHKRGAPQKALRREGVRSKRGPAAMLRVFHPALPAQVQFAAHSRGSHKICNASFFAESEIASVADSKEINPPARICFRGAWGEVMAASGPWRSGGEWWTPAPWEQDEWDLEIEFSAVEIMQWQTEKRGHEVRAVYRITRQREQNTWSVQGVYD